MTDPDPQPSIELDDLLAVPESAPAAPAAPIDERISDVMEYVDEAHRRLGLQELSRAQPVAYFLPLLHELFGGGEGKTKLLFAILHGLMLDDRVRWTRQELDERFHWLKEGHRNYLFHRLSNVGWLEYFRDRGVYMVSDKGEALMRILSRFSMGRQLVENEGAALAEIEFSLLLELDDLPERLKFLRNRLMKHAIRAEQALGSDSAYRILEIYEQLKSAYRWAEQTRQTLDHIEIDDDDVERWEAVRGVHDHLSKLHELISTMQLTLQDIQRKQIDIAHYGLTHLDIDRFLIHAPVDELSDMMYRHLGRIPHPFLVIEDNLFGEADDIVNRADLDDEDGEGRGWDTEVGDAEADAEPRTASETESLVTALRQAPSRWQSLDHLVEAVPWEVAAYRYSILTLMADLDIRQRVASNLAYDPIVSVPVEVSFDRHGKLTDVPFGDEVRSMTVGRIRALDLAQTEDRVASDDDDDDDDDDEPADPEAEATHG